MHVLKKVTWSLLIIVLAATVAEAHSQILAPPKPQSEGGPASPKPQSGERGCPPAGWSLTRLDALKRDGFTMPDAFQRHELAIAITGCLGDPKPEIRDGIAFEALSAWMRGGQLDLATLQTIRGDLLRMMARPDPVGFASSFAALALSEVARTDRLRAWLSADERDAMVRAGALFLTRVKDYRAFSDSSGFRHAVAHGADLMLQLALNPLTTKAQLDHMMLAVATQVAPDADVAYWAGEPDRLARPIVFIAQRKLHTDGEWQAFFSEVTDPKPLASWKVAFTSEPGIKKRHNVRAFLLSVYASATSSEDHGIRQLIGPVTAALKAVP
jgi:hypothetical protein